MKTATKQGDNKFKIYKPSSSAIRNLTAEIRDQWTLGERHHRARLAMLLQHCLLRSEAAAVFRKVS